MLNENPSTVPFFVHEGEMTRMERLNHRLSFLLFIVAVLNILVGLLGKGGSR